MNTVNIGKEMKEGGFKKAYHSLPHNKLIEAREDICRACYWNIGTFRAKIAGKRFFRVYEIREIEKYFAERGLDAWTGQMISNSFNN